MNRNTEKKFSTDDPVLACYDRENQGLKNVCHLTLFLEQGKGKGDERQVGALGKLLFRQSARDCHQQAVPGGEQDRNQYSVILLIMRIDSSESAFVIFLMGNDS